MGLFGGGSKSSSSATTNTNASTGQASAADSGVSIAGLTGSRVVLTDRDAVKTAFEFSRDALAATLKQSADTSKAASESISASQARVVDAFKTATGGVDSRWVVGGGVLLLAALGFAFFRGRSA